MSSAVSTKSVYYTEDDKYLFDSHSFTKKTENSVGKIDYIHLLLFTTPMLVFRQD